MNDITKITILGHHGDLVRGGLEKLKAGDAESFMLTMIPADARESWRTAIEHAAEELALPIVIRDDTDHWLDLSENKLVVMRFSDYAEAYGLPT